MHIAFHCNNGYTNAARCYAVLTLPVFYNVESVISPVDGSCFIYYNPHINENIRWKFWNDASKETNCNTKQLQDVLIFMNVPSKPKNLNPKQFQWIDLCNKSQCCEAMFCVFCLFVCLCVCVCVSVCLSVSDAAFLIARRG